MAKLSKIKIYAIKWLASQDYSIKEISDDINITQEQIKTVLEEENNSNNKTSEHQNNSIGKNLMITHTAGKKINNVAIMTKDASSVVDSVKQSSANNNAMQYSKNIYRPKKK